MKNRDARCYRVYSAGSSEVLTGWVQGKPGKFRAMGASYFKPIRFLKPDRFVGAGALNTLSLKKFCCL